MKEKKAIMTTTQLTTNTSDDKRVHIKQVAALANDNQYIHRQARLLASAYLQGAEKEIIEAEIANLDEEIREDRELYDVHEALISAIAREAVQIGRDLAS